MPASSLGGRPGPAPGNKRRDGKQRGDPQGQGFGPEHPVKGPARSAALAMQCKPVTGAPRAFFERATDTRTIQIRRKPHQKGFPVSLGSLLHQTLNLAGPGTAAAHATRADITYGSGNGCESLPRSAAPLVHPRNPGRVPAGGEGHSGSRRRGSIRALCRPERWFPVPP